jgi:hypothetical protein
MKIFFGILVALAVMGAVIQANKSPRERAADVRTEIEPYKQDLEQQMIEEALQQYAIVKRSGDKMEICMRAGVIEQSYLQAHDEKNYNAWKKIKKQDCRRAGVSF